MTAAIEFRYRARNLIKSWLCEFDCTLELWQDVASEVEERSGWRQSLVNIKVAAVADAKTRRIKLYSPCRGIDGLKLIAHEVGHIALNHRGRVPSYVQEYETERFAHALLARDGITPPRRVEWRGRLYVQDHIRRGLRHGLRSVDPRIARWAKIGTAGDHLTAGLPARYAAALACKQSRDFYHEAAKHVARALNPRWRP
jgi:hypothetical protein